MLKDVSNFSFLLLSMPILLILKILGTGKRVVSEPAPKNNKCSGDRRVMMV